MNYYVVSLQIELLTFVLKCCNYEVCLKHLSNTTKDELLTLWDRTVTPSVTLVDCGQQHNCPFSIALL